MPCISFTIPGQTTLPYSVLLDTGPLIVGRAADCNIILEHPSISSKHCEISRVEGGFVLRDLNSTNGIYLDGNQMETIDLLNGTHAQVGDLIVTHELSHEEEAVLNGETFKSQQKKKKERKPKAKSKAKVKSAVGSTHSGSTNATFQIKPDTSGRDFAIFLACAAAALFAFYLGINTAYRASIPKEDRLGRSIWKDKITGTAPEETTKPTDSDAAQL